MTKILWSLAALPLALGCASEHMGDGSDRTVASELARAEDEVQRHHEVVMNASDTTQVNSETAEHDARMRGIMAEMYESVSDDMHCSHGGKDSMHSMMASMDHAQDEHMGGLHEGQSLEALQAACTAYVADMHGLLEGMHHAQAGASCMH